MPKSQHEKNVNKKVGKVGSYDVGLFFSLEINLELLQT